LAYAWGRAGSRALPAAVARWTAPQRVRDGDRSMKPLTPVGPARRIALGVSFFVLFVAVWSAATFSGWVNPIFLPTR
jgi:hypothetical protein